MFQIKDLTIATTAAGTDAAVSAAADVSVGGAGHLLREADDRLPDGRVETASVTKAGGLRNRPSPLVEPTETPSDWAEPVSTTRGLLECIFAQTSKHI